MRERYRMYRRKNGMFYAKDRKTGQRLSLNTTDQGDAKRLLAAKNQATEQPYMNVSMAKVYLSAQSPDFLTRTWGTVLDHLQESYKGSTAVRWGKFAKSEPLKLIVNVPLYQTEATHFLSVLSHPKAGVSTNVWLRILHNRAIDLGWQLTPVLNRRLWPKIQYKSKRGITAEEHAKIVASERMDDYRNFFRLLWETGGSQSDIACLNAEDVDWDNSRLYYTRMKLVKRGKGRAALAMGEGLKTVLKDLPSEGPLFPRLRELSEDERASHFRKVCLRVGLEEITLHCYRYGWAERACSAGMPEREAQAHLGHGSRAVHRAYAKNANVVTLPLDHYEKAKAAKLLPFTLAVANEVTPQYGTK